MTNIDRYICMRCQALQSAGHPSYTLSYKSAAWQWLALYSQSPLYSPGHHTVQTH